jgi:hypothetical protein
VTGGSGSSKSSGARVRGAADETPAFFGQVRSLRVALRFGGGGWSSLGGSAGDALSSRVPALLGVDR